MSRPLPADRARLLALAKAQPIADAEVRAAWPTVVTAIENGWLLPGDAEGSIVESLATLRRTGLVGYQEYAIEEVDGEPDRLLVTLIGDSREVPRAPFEHALEELDEDFRAGRGPAPEPPPAEPPAPPDAETLRDAFQLLLGAGGRSPDTAEAAGVRAEAHAELERLSGSGDEELRAALDGLTEADRAGLANAMRTFADWAEHPEGRGDAVDEVLRVLEGTIGRLLPGRRAEERATEERIRSSAQDAIARRLRGLDSE